jgi:site-specific DNA recombinase
MALTGTSLAGLPLGLYCRYSKLLGGDAALGRQDDDAREFAAECGARDDDIVKVWVEKKSAWKQKRITLADGRVISRVVRPDFAELLEFLRAGTIRGAVVYDLDRLTRDLRDCEDAIEVAEIYGAVIVGPGVDLSTPHGRDHARAQAVAAHKASSATSRRVARAHRQAAVLGVPMGGARPFGWNEDKRTLRPAEAGPLRSAVGRVTDRVPVAAIVREWNTAGLVTAQGHGWQVATLARMLRNPRLCGIRAQLVSEQHPDGRTTTRMMPVHDRDGQIVRGQWDPILTTAEWDRLIAVIGAEGSSGRGANARRYLLSGICRCGQCGRKMYGRLTGRNQTPTYACRAATDGGCGKVSRVAAPVDEHVTEAVFAKIEREMTNATAQLGPWDRAGELTETRESIAALNQRWRAVPRQVSPSNYFPSMDVFEERERELVAAHDTYLARVAQVTSRPANVRAEWDDYTLPQQRALIQEHLIAVIVQRSGKGRRPFNPDLLEPVWND